jgi:hypothetical protein
MKLLNLKDHHAYRTRVAIRVAYKGEMSYIWERLVSNGEKLTSCMRFNNMSQLVTFYLGGHNETFY